MKPILLVIMYMLTVQGFATWHTKKKSFPKITYTKIHDVSYRVPIRIRRMEPFAFTLVKQIRNIFTNYINERYAMASFPLSYNFANQLNETKLNEKK